MLPYQWYSTTFLPPYNTGVDSLSFLYSNCLTFHSLYSHINFIVGKVEKCRLLKAHSYKPSS